MMEGWRERNRERYTEWDCWIEKGEYGRESKQHTAHSTQHAAQSIQHAACSIQHTAHSGIQHTAYSTQQAAMVTYGQLPLLLQGHCQRVGALGGIAQYLYGERYVGEVSIRL